MDIHKVKTDYRLAQWAGVIKERNGSGLTIKAYCNSAGIDENSYYYWLRKLRKATGDGPAGIMDNDRRLPSPVFAEVRIPEPPGFPPGGDVPLGCICVEARGLRITADGGYPADKLAVLLKDVVWT